MDKKTWWSIGIILALIFGVGAYAYFSKPTQEEFPANTQQKQVANEEDSQSGDSGQNTESKGVYTDYSPEAVENATGGILLFFHAPWCPQCRVVEESINTTSLPDGLTILKVDYDSNQALRQQYGVTLQTTFVKIDKQGNKIKSFVAYDEPTFDAVKRELLP